MSGGKDSRGTIGCQRYSQAEDSPILRVGSLNWDLSNLCSAGNVAPSSPRRQLFLRSQSMPIRRRSEASLYPRSEAIRLSLPDVDINEIFDRCGSRTQRPVVRALERTRSLPNSTEFNRNNSGNQSSLQNRWTRLLPDKGTHESDNPADFDDCQEAQPILLSPKEPGRCCSADYDLSYHSSQEYEYQYRPNCATRTETRMRLENPVEYDDYLQSHPITPPPQKYRLHGQRSNFELSYNSHQEVGYDYTPNRPAAREQRIQVEVSPGHFMHLRGAKETLYAIETGRSKVVFCFACGAGLRCVADCELVICPDCRIMSPVPHQPPSLTEFDESDEHDLFDGVPDCPSIWQEDNDYGNERSKRYRQPSLGGRALSIGGVGLGVKV